MKVALMTSSLILERLFMLAAQYLPEDFNVTLTMTLYTNCALPLTFHFSKSTKVTDKHKGKSVFVVFYF